MIDTDKYEGHSVGKWRVRTRKGTFTVKDCLGDEVAAVNDYADAQLIADAPLLLAEVKTLQVSDDTLSAIIEMIDPEGVLQNNDNLLAEVLLMIDLQERVDMLLWRLHTAQVHALAYEEAKTDEARKRTLDMLLTVLGAHRYCMESEGDLGRKALDDCSTILSEAFSLDDRSIFASDESWMPGLDFPEVKTQRDLDIEEAVANNPPRSFMSRAFDFFRGDEGK